MDTYTHHIYCPDYIAGFQCIAGRCRHSCCIGWEIDIDDASYEKYRKLEGPLGEKLRANMCPPEEDSPAHFILGENERCPFLNAKGLCELILGLGENSLCEICSEHPRFYQTLSDRTEMGFGLCCEESARLLISHPAPIHMIDVTSGMKKKSLFRSKKHFSPELLYEDTFSGSRDDDEAEILTIRHEIFSILQDRNLSLGSRISAIEQKLELPGTDPDIPYWGAFLEKLERLDPTWDIEIGKLTDKRKIDVDAFAAMMVVTQRSFEYENFIGYLLYRHLWGALEDGYIGARVQFAILAFRLIEYLGACRFTENGVFTTEDQIDLMRMFSSEIEYSDENVDLLIEEILKRDGAL